MSAAASGRLRIVAPSIVDPLTARNGAATLTRGLLAILRSPSLAARVELFSPPISHGWLQTARQAVSLVRAVGSRYPAKLRYTRTPGLERALRDALAAGPPDLLLLNGADMLWAQDLFPAETPRVIVAHNLEQEVLRAQIERAPRLPGLRALLEDDLRRLERIETEGFQSADAVIFVSPDEQARVRAETPDLRTAVLPPVFEYRASGRTRRPAGGGVIELGFLGNLAWWPNREGLAWFLDQVLPELGGRARLHVFGPHSRRYVRSASAVTVHGFATDLRLVWDRCDLFVNPVRVGAGVSIKTAETLYNGSPQLVSSFAARGLGLRDEPSVVISDSPREWIDLLSSPAAWRLAATRPSDAARRRFSLEDARDEVHQLVAAAAGLA